MGKAVVTQFCAKKQCKNNRIMISFDQEIFVKNN